MPMSGKFAFSAYAGRGPETGFEEIHGHAVAPRDGRKRTTMEVIYCLVVLSGLANSQVVGP